MDISTITGFARNSIQDTIKMLEERGFYVLHSGSTSHAPRTHHKTLEARRRAKALDTSRVERAKRLRAIRERRYEHTLKGRWKNIRKALNSRARRKGEEHRFLITYEEWVLLWRKAGVVVLGDGSTTPAWRARGRDKTGGWGSSPDVVQLRRWDLSKAYSLDNIYVIYKNDVLANGWDIAEQLLNDEKEFENS